MRYLIREFKDKKKMLCKYLGQKTRTKEAVGPQLNSQGELLTESEMKELLSSFYTSVFTERKSNS